jgi:hypothetical protein
VRRGVVTLRLSFISHVRSLGWLVGRWKGGREGGREAGDIIIILNVKRERV